MIKHAVNVLAFSWILICLSGCIQYETVVFVKKDGSGIIHKTLLMNQNGFIARLESMADGLGVALEKGDNSPKNEPDHFEIFNEAKLKKEACDLGQGVKYISGQKFSKGTFSGYKAKFIFSDINKLKINPAPKDCIPFEQVNMEKTTDAQDKMITFKFTKGKPSELIILKPGKKSVDKSELSREAPQSSQMKDQQIKMLTAKMMQMFDGMKIYTAVEIQGNIIETNASYNKGERVILIDLDFEKLFKQPEQIAKLARSQPQNMDDALSLFKNVPGAEVDFNEEVFIKFKD